MVKQIIMYTSLNLGKPSYLAKDMRPLFGQGILSSSGTIWAHQRKIIAPELYLNKVKKAMVNLIVDSTNIMLRSWDTRLQSEGGVSEIKVDEDLRSLSADIISIACFGSNYVEGKEIFTKLRDVQRVLSTIYAGIPGFRFMIYNCKNIFFAEYETTATATSWCLMLLALHQDWQDRVRAEVLEVCGSDPPNADMLRNLKALNMVIQETLRLYPPAPYVVREAYQNINLKGIVIPKGMNIQIPIPLIQQNPKLWGPDAHKFNPERFSKGVSEASNFSQSYIPFGIGARICPGQNLAMVELKVILSLILMKFRFSLSPSYCHSPAFRLVIEPDQGVVLKMTTI
ncbi:hypothetical protein TanjilG_16222 [Lupinus angustifolius]|uniref:Cytochrome P450 n=1 Tax=Lupinus angustifolius TaxID=3871 RepID=A0A1J7HGW4_LUPAN|nr:hypothetical protein TanjilG_16222 [Lupinus angustifolius]